MWDVIFNHLLNAYNYLLEWIGVFKKIDDLGWFGTPIYAKEFRKGLWWGSYHDNEMYSYFDDSNVTLGVSTARLIQRFDPKVNHHNNIEMRYSKGVIMTKEPIKDKYIEVCLDIKPSSGMWHAVWLIAAGEGDEINVLPEIDIAEIYTENNPNKAYVKSNIHYGYDYLINPKSIGSMTHPSPGIFEGEFTVACDMNDDRIDILYEGRLVRRITDKSILDRLKHGVYLIVNTSVNPRFKITDGEMTMLYAGSCG